MSPQHHLDWNAHSTFVSEVELLLLKLILFKPNKPIGSNLQANGANEQLPNWQEKLLQLVGDLKAFSNKTDRYADQLNALVVNRPESKASSMLSQLDSMPTTSKLNLSAEKRVKGLPIIIAADLAPFTEGTVFDAVITHVNKKKKLEFYVRLGDQPDLSELENMLHLYQLESLPPHGNTAFGILLGKVIYRAIRIDDPHDCDEGDVPMIRLIDLGGTIKYCEELPLYWLPLKHQNLPVEAICCMLVGVACSSQEMVTDAAHMNEILSKKLFEVVTLQVLQHQDDCLHVVLRTSVEQSTDLKYTGSTLAENNVLDHSTAKEDNNNNTDEGVTEKVSPSTNPFHNPTVEYTELRVSTNNPFYADLADQYEVHDDETDGTIKSVKVPLSDMYPFMDDSVASGKVQNLSMMDIISYETNACNSVPLADTNPFLYKAYAQIPAYGQCEDILEVEIFSVNTFNEYFGMIQTNASQIFWTDDVIHADQKLEGPLFIDQLVICKLKDDGLWYRAKVVKVDMLSDLYHVLFVDSGKQACVPLDALAHPKAEWLQEPFRFISMHFTNVKDVLSKDAFKHFDLGLRVINGVVLKKIHKVKYIYQDVKGEVFVEAVNEELKTCLTLLAKLQCIEMQQA